MKRGIQSFQGERLVEARLARGLTKTALSEMCEISQQTLSAYETNKTKPMEENVERMALVLNFPMGFFSRPASAEPVERVFWRDQVSDTQKSKDRTGQRIKWAREAFSVLSDYVEFPGQQLPQIDLPSNWKDFSDEDIEFAAEACRAAWGLGDYPIPDMILALENMGILVLAFEIESQKQSGFHFFSHEIERAIIGTNTRDTSVFRQRFNVAHELGHALLHSSVLPSEIGSRQAHRKIENQAHRFAGALLFPRDAFLRQVRYPSLEEFASHKREWGISISAQIVRATQLGLCSRDQAEFLNRQASRRGYRRPMGEPFDDQASLEKPRMLRRAVEAVEEGSEVLLQSVRERLSLPKSEEVSLFGRNLDRAGSNVIQLKRV